MRAADFSRGVFFSAKFACALRTMASANLPRARIFHRSRNFSEAAILRFSANPLSPFILSEDCKFFTAAFFLARRFFFHSLRERSKYRNGIAHFGMGGGKKFGYKSLSARVRG